MSVNGTLKEFTWLSQGQVVLEAAPEVGAEVLIYRDTPVDEPIVDYEDGSIITESDLDLPVLQHLYVAQELKDSAADTSDTAEAAVDTANKAADAANTALTTSNESLDTANTALESASSAVTIANAALESIGPTVKQEVSNQDIPKQVSDNVDDKLEALNLDTKIHEEVVSAISGVTIPGLTPETIEGALGYIPYDGETNSKDFATNSEVAEAIAAIPNADWNATDGAAYIKNKPALSVVATSGNYADLQNKPATMTGATAEAAGTSGFVPVPAAGDEDKVLKGDGTWGEVDLGGIVTELNGKADKDLSNISENIAYIVDSYHDDEGNWYRKWSDGWVEQGGQFLSAVGVGAMSVVNLHFPADVVYFGWSMANTATDGTASSGGYTQPDTTKINFYQGWAGGGTPVRWYACGMGAE